MRRLALAGVALLVALAAFLAWGLRFRRVPEPTLPGTLASGSLEHQGRTRSWHAYLPAKHVPHPALVLVLHGSEGDWAQARGGYGYDFDRLAEEEGLIPAYPDGFERHWNDCRKAAPYAANTLDVDDVGFLHKLVDQLSAEHDVDRNRVFATGISNGGQMALRLAFEAPDWVHAVAPVVASLPAEGNMDCKLEGRALSALIMNGTDDPMNPWAGGDAALYGVLGNRGGVLSSEDSIDYFRDLAGYTGPPEVVALPDRDPSDGSTVEVRRWSAPGRKNVVLYVIRGGGHNAPHPELRVPRLLGHTNADISAAREIWRFFSEAP